jgi:hypothetical protein
MPRKYVKPGQKEADNLPLHVVENARARYAARGKLATIGYVRTYMDCSLRMAVDVYDRLVEAGKIEET